MDQIYFKNHICNTIELNIFFRVSPKGAGMPFRAGGIVVEVAVIVLVWCNVHSFCNNLKLSIFHLYHRLTFML
jgi:hypothetical protein